jgi:hypothetical protein
LPTGATGATDDNDDDDDDGDAIWAAHPLESDAGSCAVGCHPVDACNRAAVSAAAAADTGALVYTLGGTPCMLAHDCAGAATHDCEGAVDIGAIADAEAAAAHTVGFTKGGAPTVTEGGCAGGTEAWGSGADAVTAE